jgi:hypothetical protein
MHWFIKTWLKYSSLGVLLMGAVAAMSDKLLVSLKFMPCA